MAMTSTGQSLTMTAPLVSGTALMVFVLLPTTVLATDHTLCEPKWTDIHANHTMCQPDVGEEVAVTQEAIDAVIAQTNRIRARVEPTAADMTKMVWDEELATVAAKQARLCTDTADNPDHRGVPSLPGITVGETWGLSNDPYSGLQEAVEGWQWFGYHFKYAHYAGRDDSTAPYTQLVMSRAQRMGCGQAKCPGQFPNRITCNYAPAQTFSEMIKPYQKGESCSRCPHECDESGKLCDFKGKICLHGGRLDMLHGYCLCPAWRQGELCQDIRGRCQEGKMSRRFGHCDSAYSKCVNGHELPLHCPPSLIFNNDNGMCDWPARTECHRHRH